MHACAVSSNAPTGRPFEYIFQPQTIRGLRLQSRVLMAPMEKNLCTAEGTVTQRYVDYLVERAQAGVGLLRTEATYVDALGKGRPYQLGAHSDAVIPPLARLVEEVHQAGGRISLELAHCGRQTDSRVTGRQPVAPSAVPCQLSGGFIPRELTIGEIDEIIERFASAALRAQKAGVDAIEIHGASGYLLNAFTSPYTNFRTDEYGGTFQNRVRFALEIVRAIRDVVGTEIPLLYRLCADEFVEGGLTREESGPLASELEQAGIDLIDVSAGTYESILATQPPMEADPGSLLDLARAIKQHVQIPIATAGKLGDLETAEAAIAGGAVDFVTIGRGLHADPELLVKARSGRSGEIRRCIACAECVAFLGQGLPAYCAVNPRTIREGVLAEARSPARRRVMVIGGGPAGLEAARAAALRGHEVNLFERAGQIGGRARLGALARGRDAFAEPIAFLGRELERLSASVHLNREVGLDTVEAANPDLVVVATGARPARRTVPGFEFGHVLGSEEFLEWTAREDDAAPPPTIREADNVAILGGNWVACHIASLLLDRGKSVAIVDLHESLAYDMGDQQGTVLREHVREHAATTLHLRSTVEAVEPDLVHIWAADQNRKKAITAQAIIVVESPQRDLELADAIRARLDSAAVFAIGDCVEPRKLADALLDGAMIGSAI
jgi:2,4-dienoyl-CoA reductase-like NADH-dependent reductase (Old Yellow Enzyme family)/NADPH-dependent 2,4-dienoyl-CoA reductase/sulfur reductase-like enzyme